MKILFLLLFFLSSVFGARMIKIAEYNVQNLFDLQRSGYEYKEYVPYGKSGWNAKIYRTKLRHTARVIKDLDADIVALVEIESKTALLDLRKTLQGMGVYYKYYAIADKKNTTVKVAVLSKIPFIATKELWVGRSYKYRNILELKYKVDSELFYLYVNHWKSKSGAESQRIKSAKVLRRRLEELGFTNNFIVTGDFNSDYEEYIKFKRKRKHNDTRGATGINHVLATLEDDPNAVQQTQLYNLWYELPEEQRWNYIHRKKKENLDSIIISKPLLVQHGMWYKKGSFGVLRKPYLFYKKRINSWYISYRGGKPRHMGKGYSDHLPIFATFVIK